MSNFQRKEFECKCGCGAYNMQLETLAKLEDARLKANIPFRIASGTRCPAHNAAVGGKTDSEHLYGAAVDVTALTGETRGKVLIGLIQAGFQRIGIGKDFIHADISTRKVFPCVWLY